MAPDMKHLGLAVCQAFLYSLVPGRKVLIILFLLKLQSDIDLLWAMEMY